MSLKANSNKSKSSMSQNTTEATDNSVTNTVNTPSWVSDLSGAFAGQIPNARTQVAGLSGLQQDAVGGLSGQNFGGMFGDAADLAKGAATDFKDFNPSALGGVGAWLNPFLGGVVDATTADLDANDARTRAQQDLAIAGNNAFGGSGAALTKSLTEGELERARASTLGGLRMGAFDSAAGNSQQDKTRELQGLIAGSNAKSGAATQLGSLGSTGLGLQRDLGETQRGISQDGLDNDLNTLIAQLGLFGALPADLLTTVNSRTQGTGTSNTTGTAKGKTSGVGAGVSWSSKSGIGG